VVPLDVAVDVRLSGSFGQNRVRWPARPRVRLAKVLQLAPPGVAEKARDPPPLLICLRVRIRLTIRISLAAAQARNTAARPAHVTVRAAIAPPQSHIRKRCGRGTISLSSVRCERRCSIKCPDGAFAPREGTGFVTVERYGARKRCPIQGLHGKEIGARAAHPRHIHLRTRDAAGHLEPLPAGLRPRDGTGQGGNLVRKCRIEACRLAQPVANGVAR
jgi:hypothetical protein